MGFIVASLNVGSIINFRRRDELLKFLRTNHIDLCLVQETKLDGKIKFRFDGYNVLRNDCKRGRSGTAIILRDNIPIRNSKFFSDQIHSNSVEIYINKNWTCFASAYFPPGLPLSFDFINNFFKLHRGSLIGGDFNGRNVAFGDHSDNLYGIHILNSIDGLSGSIINPPSPTCFHTINGSFIDKFINLSSNVNIGAVRVLASFSDHAAIQTDIPTSNNTPPILTKRYDYDHTNMDKFNKFLEINTKRLVIPLRENISHSRADQLVDDYNKIIQTAIERFVPMAKTNMNSRIILSAHTKFLQKSCKNIQRKLFRNQNAQFNLRRINQISGLRIMIRNSMNLDTSSFFTNTFNEIQTPIEAFRVIRNFTSHKKREPMGGSIFLDATKTTSVCGNVDIANALGKMFVTNNNITSATTSPMDQIVGRDIRLLNAIDTNIVFNNFVSPLITDDTDITKNSNNLPPHQQNILTDVTEVTQIINSRPNKKSSGFDNLPFTLIKQYSPVNILFLVILFNHLLAIAHFPSSWKNALVSGIPKPNRDSSIITNWRPISQLSCISKVFEKVMANRLSAITHRLKIFNNQYGFLKNNSCENALAKIQNKINHGLNNGKITTMVAVDLKAAFDVVWHDGLIHKMIKLGISPCICKLIQSFLKNRGFAIGLNGFISDVFMMKDGSPQGSVISPSLFNILTHDIPLNRHVSITQFADDITIHLTHNNPPWAQNIINCYLADIFTYLKNWKLLLSDGKTELINIIGRVSDTNRKLRARARRMKISLNGQLIPISNNIRLLGVQFQANNLFTKNIKIRIEKARRAKMAVKRILSNSVIESKIKTNIYKLYIRPILTYGAPVWCQPPHVSAHQMELLRIFERSCLRGTANIRRNIGSFKHVRIKDIYDASNCTRIDKFISQLHINFYEKCRRLNNAKFSFSNFPCRYNRYKPVYYIYKLHKAGRLLRNDKLLLFHKRFNNRPGLVYNPSQ